MSNSERRINRTLTQKYDMQALRALQKLETDFLETLCDVYGCDEDDMPVDVDLLAVYNGPKDQREAELKSLLKDAPKDTSSIIAKLVQEMKEVDKLPNSK